MDMLKEFYGKLPSDKIKINWNKNPITMNDFLSFLTVPTVRSQDHLGSGNGWSLLVNEDLKLRAGGGVINRIEYLDSLQLGKNLNNPYNNYVNPFYLWDILTKDGQDFFISYYADEITGAIKKTEHKIKVASEELKRLKAYHSRIIQSTNKTV